MQDPVKTIKDLLNTGWIDDDSALDKDNITWRFGPPENPLTRFQDKEISFEFNSYGLPRKKRTKARAQGRRVVMMDCWLRLRPADVRETFQGYKQTIADKVDTLVAASETSATGLDLIYVYGDPRNLDADDCMRIQIEIICIYQV